MKNSAQNRRNETAYRDYWDNAPLAYHVLDKNGVILDVNLTEMKMLGYTRQEMIGRPIFDFVLPEQCENARARFQRKIAGKKMPKIQDRIYVKKDGSEFYADIEDWIDYGRDGEIIVKTIMRDVTVEKRAAQLLAESEERFRLQFQNMPIPSYTWEKTARGIVLTGYNNAAEIITRRGIHKLLGKSLEEAYPDRSDIIKDIQKCLTQKIEFRRELRCRYLATGEAKNMSVTYAYIPPATVIVHTIDITDRKKTEDKIKYDYEIQSVLNKLIKISLAEKPLEKMLDEIIGTVLSVGWIKTTAKAGIWLLDGGSRELKLTAQHGLSRRVRANCRVVPSGVCLCGKTAATGQIEFVDHSQGGGNSKHAEGASHAHYCVPIKFRGRVMGVINFYLQTGHAYDRREVGFLKATGNVIAGIIERQRTNMELRHTQEKCRKLIDNTGEAVMIIDEKGYFNYANNAFFRITGYFRGDMGDLHFSKLIHPDDHDRAVRLFNDQLEGRAEGASSEYKVLSKDGRTLYLSYSNSPIKESGRVAGVQVIARDITENKVLEQRIGRAKNHYESVIDTIKDGILVVDRQFKAISVNRAFAEKTGINLREIKGRFCHELLPKYEHGLFKNHCVIGTNKEKCILTKVFARANTSYLTEKNIDRDGHVRYHKISVFPTKNSHGEVYQAVLYIQDITARKLAGEEIRKLQEFSQRILDNAPMSIITIDRQGRIMSANKFADSVSETKKLVGENIFKTAFFENAGLSGKYRALLTRGRPFIKDNCRTADQSGRTKYLNIIAAPMLDETGRVDGALSIALDNTEAAEAKERLQGLNRDLEQKIEEGRLAQEKIYALNELNQKILDNVPLSIVLLDLKSTVIAANVMAKKLMDVPESEIVGHRLTQTFEIKKNKDLRGHYRALLKQGRPFHYENLSYVQGTDGAKKSLNIIAVPLFDQQGKVEAAISMALDNTEAVEAKQKLHELNRELEKKVIIRTQELHGVNKRLSDILDLKTKFVADASHELRTPLTVIRGNLDLAVREAQNNNCADTPEIYRLIMDEVSRMSLILSDLTMLTNADIGSEQLACDKIDLLAIAKTAVQSLKILADKKNIRLETRLTGKPVFAMGDEPRLEKMLLNIVRNGIKYSNRGGRVRIEVAKNGHEALIKITDNGIGIPEEDLPHIFERFYRVDKSRSRQEGGSGLGLSIAKWIAEAHHGSIDAKSALGKGSIFMVHLPFDYKKSTDPLKLF